MPTATAQRPDQYVGKQVRIARVSKGWHQSDLVAKLEELGYTQWRQSKVAKIENGEVKRLALDDVLALTAALGVQLAHLLTPEQGDVALTARVTAPAANVRMWLRGFLPLYPENEKSYFTGALVPENEWRDFVRGVEYAGLYAVGPEVAILTRTTPEREAWKEELSERRATLRAEETRDAS
jgi:transcriptional regulator with XRE-family HTH domain